MNANCSSGRVASPTDCDDTCRELLHTTRLPPKEQSRLALAILMSEEVDSWEE